MSKDIISLEDVNEKDTFLAMTCQASRLSVPPVSAIWSTVSTLRDSALSFIPSQLLIFSNRKDQNTSISSPSSETQAFIGSLVRAAHQTAEAFSCSSVLAGQGSESDEYGDVGVWLDSASISRSSDDDTLEGCKSVLAALGLEHWGHCAIFPVPLSATSRIPFSLNVSPSDPRTTTLTGLLEKLQNTFAFRVEHGVEAGGNVLYILVGRLREAQTDGWAGLLGLGTWSD